MLIIRTISWIFNQLLTLCSHSLSTLEILRLLAWVLPLGKKTFKKICWKIFYKILLIELSKGFHPSTLIAFSPFSAKSKYFPSLGHWVSKFGEMCVCARWQNRNAFQSFEVISLLYVFNLISDSCGVSILAAMYTENVSSWRINWMWPHVGQWQREN